MKATSTLGISIPALRTLALAAAMACGTGASVAAPAVANLSITSFTVTAELFSGNFVSILDPFQSHDMSALDAGGLNGADTDSGSANNWDRGINWLATTTFATATGNLEQFTDPSTQLTTAGFNLAATALPWAVPVGSGPNSANASALLDGTFILVDDNGDPVGGTIFFDIWYEQSVDAPANYAQTLFNLAYSNSNGDTTTFGDSLLSTDFAGGTGASSGRHSWSFDLAAGEFAYYTVSGSAIAMAAVPEPSSFALFGMGIVALASITRRRKTPAKDA